MPSCREQSMKADTIHSQKPPGTIKNKNGNKSNPKRTRRIFYFIFFLLGEKTV